MPASDDTLLSRWAALIEHSQEHFDREDQWMLDTGFAFGNCHATQHGVILQDRCKAWTRRRPCTTASTRTPRH
jgi:hemerythrin